MYEKPDLDTPLAQIRENAEKFNASLQRHGSDEGRGKGFAFDIGLLEERDDIAAAIVKDFGVIDTEMSRRRVIDSPAPAAWTIDRLTDEQLAACKADWPELGMFADGTIRRVADVLGIRMVRAMAQEAVRRAPAVLQARESK
ncbi:hypothetical protein SSP531S_59130 [Streptomyces spongiicola]|uniref:Uncharacterized protein n=1 Tax=Streptomyces spongiicola TaxID=1690221 RepID=A0A388T679_9ACTN|nr:hypothetical protein [Streptomyces spongiicola]GBQ04417.1 hypothetical protein SSP531S_59130 [Streptomyces spongiicola]